MVKPNLQKRISYALSNIATWYVLHDLYSDSRLESREICKTKDYFIIFLFFRNSIAGGIKSQNADKTPFVKQIRMHKKVPKSNDIVPDVSLF